MTLKKIVGLTTLIAAFVVGLAFEKASRSSTSPEPRVASADPPSTGEITGRVAFEGTKPTLTPVDVSKDPVCKARHKTPLYSQDGEVNSNGTLPNVFVYVKSGADASSGAPPTQHVILDQRGCTYLPHVLGIMVGQKLEVISSDPTTHNVHPQPRQNQEWNQSQPPGAAPIVKSFTRPEVMIPVKCNQHPWMKAYIGVMSNPFYAATGSAGTFTIKRLPPGEYTLEAWTATFGTQRHQVSVRAGESTAVDFAFRAH